MKNYEESTLPQSHFSADTLNEHIRRLKSHQHRRSHVVLENPAGPEFDADVAQTALRGALNACERDHALDEKVFRKILPQVHNSLTKIVERIHDVTTGGCGIVESTLNDTRRSLSTCEELLNLCRICLDRISNIGKVSVNAVRSLLDTLPETIKVCFQHCKSSQTAYGPLFDKLTRELASLFRKANANLRLFLITLEDGVIVFDTDVQSETELLAKVISAIGTAAVIANGMDLKTFVETVKSFGRLALRYHNSINRISSGSVTTHIRSLAESACILLSEIQKSGAKIEERAVKSVSLTIKVLEKLIAAYGSSANKETLSSLVDLLVRMYRCSPDCLRVLKIDEKTIEMVSSRISVAGAELLLNRIFDAANIIQFKQVYFEYGSQFDVDKLGYHAVTLGIMRKLVAAYHREWTVESRSIVDVAFANIDCLHEELCCGEMQLPGAYSVEGQLRPVGIYEATLMLICHLVAKVSSSDFHIVELTLMKHLLSGRFWSSLLSLDVWSFVGRFASVELCESYVKYFMKIYATLERQGDRAEAIVIGNLIERLYSLLPSGTRHAVVRNLQRTDFHSWIPLLPHLTNDTRSLLRDRLVSSSSASKAFADLCDQNVSRHWFYLTKLLRAMGKLECAAGTNVIDVSSNIWNLVASTIENYDDRQVRVSMEIVSVLLDIGRSMLVYEETYLSMLHAAVAISLSMPSYVIIRMAFRIRDDVCSFNDCSLQVADALAELNCRVLDEANPIVFQEGLESFDQIVNMCPDESLIRKLASAVMKKPPWVSEIVRAYMSNVQCCGLQDYANVESYIRHLACASKHAPVHICNSYDDSHKDEKYPRIEEESTFFEGFNSGSYHGEATSPDLDQRVDKICNQLHGLYERKSDISVNAMRKLTAALSKLTDCPYSSVEST